MTEQKTTNERTNEPTNNQIDYRHRHIDIDISSESLSRERRFYVPKDFEQTMKELDKILNREGSNISRWIRSQAQKYVNLHSPGNPQQTIQRFVEGKKAYIASDPCFFNCGRPSQFLASYGKEDKLYKVCKVHANCISKNMLQRNFQFLRWRIVSSIEKV
jgi:hypothetical protein